MIQPLHFCIFLPAMIVGNILPMCVGLDKMNPIHINFTKVKYLISYISTHLQGSVFFALPDGTGLLYVLAGQADAPKPIGNVQKDVPCKTSYTEVLTVSNWLRKPQRYLLSACVFH